MGATIKVHVNVFLTHSYQVVKSKSFWTMNKTEERVKINEQKKGRKD